MSSPSILSEYTATLALGSMSAAPVTGSYIQPCQGHTTFPSRMTPWPSGPPRWRQTLSMAEYLPSTLATQSVLSPTVNSRASPSSGRSEVLPMRIQSGMLSVAFGFWLFRLQRLRNHHLTLEVLHHVLGQPYFGGTLGERHLVNLVLQFQQRIEEVLRPRRTADHVHIRGHDLVHALQHRIRVERPAHRGASAHGDDPFGVWHLVINALHDRRHLQRDRTGHDHQVALARAGAEDFRAEASNVEARSRRRDHLDGAARQAKGHRPDGRLARPVEDVINRGDQEILFELVL